MKYTVPFVVLLLLSGCSKQPHIVKTTDIRVSSAQQVYIVRHGWHTGIVVPSGSIFEQLPQLKARFAGTQFIEFGWGDNGFYQAEEITSGLTMQAIFWPTRAVIHAVSIPESAKSYFPDSQIASLCLPGKRYSKLIQFIENSFSKDGNGNLFPLTKGIYGNSQFYEGEGDFYLINTCNKWTAKGLSSAEMDISTTFKLTAGSIMDYLAEQNANETSSSNECDTSTEP